MSAAITSATASTVSERLSGWMSCRPILVAYHTLGVPGPL